VIRLILTRLHFGKHATIGKLIAEKCVYKPSLDSYLKNGCLEKTSFCCYTLEDTVRGDGDPATVAEWKIKGKSAIPYGTYKFRVARSPKRGYLVIWIDGVPGFQAIQIHIGNKPEDTEGCILVGMEIGQTLPSGMTIARSREAFGALMEFVGNESGILEVRK
jgi:hypothetical protein